MLLSRSRLVKFVPFLLENTKEKREKVEDNLKSYAFGLLLHRILQSLPRVTRKVSHQPSTKKTRSRGLRALLLELVIL